ncbi:hypothetical protein [Alicyclobacillus sp. ALC3]|uniref:hypothetical protein n=1 Tax=Alicyclobacillus sp. ALC3 TaxID=2796143 RepID=UPI002378B10A|nr:hypothetical protein [Alicyclobacillus sp. ALC3]WDL95239.1 hypothetical protein JC200_12510 [Alicyclobacillus sp. ALC3]
MAGGDHTSHRPVFIHSGMRTGSTYFLDRFRVLRDTMCFTEPFQEILSAITVETVRGLGPRSWHSRHSDTEPYFLEYEALLNGDGKGIHGFREEFSFQNYYVVNEDLPHQREYLENLLRLARTRGTTPVLGFVRSLGRLEWMRRNFPDAYHIVLVRNPAQQWYSGYSIYKETKNVYFMNVYRSIGINPGNHEYMQEFKRQAGEALHTDEVRLDFLYEYFLQVYATSTMDAVRQADLIVDMDRLSQSVAYRDYVTEQIAEHTDCRPNFSGARLPTHSVLDVPVDMPAVNQFIVNVFRNWLRSHPLPPVADGLEPAYERTPNFVLEKIETSVPRAASVATPSVEPAQR